MSGRVVQRVPGGVTRSARGILLDVDREGDPIAVRFIEAKRARRIWSSWKLGDPSFSCSFSGYLPAMLLSTLRWGMQQARQAGGWLNRHNGGLTLVAVPPSLQAKPPGELVDLSQAQ